MTISEAIHDRDLSLADTYRRRKESVTFRASAVFPVKMNQQFNVIISLLNYWLIKNHISSVLIDYRIHTTTGELVKRSQVLMNDEKMLNIDVKNELEGLTEEFLGSIHVDVLSEKNLRYPYPGINYYLISQDNVTALHASGRVKNAEESQDGVDTSETNWTCVNRPDLVPVFYAFNGGMKQNDVEYAIELRNKDNQIIHSYIEKIEEMNPFSCNMVKISADAKLIEDEYYYIRVRFCLPGIYPRLVVGMIDEKKDNWYLTHSTPVIDTDDDVLSYDADETDSQAFVVMLTDPRFDARVVFFPTHPGCPKVKLQSEDDTLQHDVFPSREDGRLGVINAAEPDGRVVAYRNVSGPVPSRWHINYLYSVKGCEQLADVATQISNKYLPKKQHHWGFGILSDTFDTVLCTHLQVSDPEINGPKPRGIFTIYDETGLIASNVLEFEYSKYKNINLKDYVSKEIISTEPLYLGWMIKLDPPSWLRGNWVTYDQKGKICGDHFI